MMSAPSEMRCKSIPENAIAVKTMASTRDRDGDDGARAKAKADQAHGEYDRDRLPQRLMNSSTACSTVNRLVRDEVGPIPTGRPAMISCMACSTSRPSARTSPACALRWQANGVLSAQRNIGCGGSAGPRVTRAISLSGIMRPYGEVDLEEVLLALERPRDAAEDLLWSVCTVRWG